jgi:RNA polymerase primary sigma factor
MAAPNSSGTQASTSTRAKRAHAADVRPRRLGPRGPRSRGGSNGRSGRAKRRGGEADNQPGLLEAYVREVGSHKLLTPQEEVALSKAIETHSTALHEALLRIPWTARFLVARWEELRRAKRVTAALGALSPGQRDPDASVRIDRTMSRVAALLRRHAALADRRNGSARERARIDTRIQELLLVADLSPSVLREALDVLREHHDSLSRRERSAKRSRSRAELAREIGLSIPLFRQRMREIESHARALREARNRFAEHNLKLVVKIAKEFAGMGLPLIDLVQEGNLGLLHAVQKFDHRRGSRFSTYGSWWIRQACIRAIQNQSRTIRLPSHVYDQAIKMERARTEISTRLGRVPETEELSAALQVSEERVEDVLLACRNLVSLEDPVPGLEDRSVADAIANPADRDLGDAIDQDRITGEIGDLLQDLPRREQQVLRWRFGFGREQPHTLREIGDRMGLSRERVRQIESGALERLRAGLEERRLLGGSSEEDQPLPA